MGDENVDQMMETDAPAFKQAADLDGPLSVHARHVGRIRREFMCSIVAALVACPNGGSDHAAYWDFAEALFLEGQRRGVLP